MHMILNISFIFYMTSVLYGFHILLKLKKQFVVELVYILELSKVASAYLEEGKADRSRA